MSARQNQRNQLSPGAAGGGGGGGNPQPRGDGGIIAETVQSVRDLGRITSPYASNVEQTGDPFTVGNRTLDAVTPGDNPENDALQFEQDVSDTTADAADAARNLGPNWLDELVAVAIPAVVVVAVLFLARPLLTILANTTG